MNHEGTKTQRRSKENYVFQIVFTLWLRAFVVVILLFPSAMVACPRCLEASPYKTGLFWAVLMLLPIPFILASLLFLWIRRASKAPFPPI
jgi:hypothetical protein